MNFHHRGKTAGRLAHNSRRRRPSTRGGFLFNSTESRRLNARGNKARAAQETFRNFSCEWAYHSGQSRKSSDANREKSGRGWPRNQYSRRGHGMRSDAGTFCSRSTWPERDLEEYPHGAAHALKLGRECEVKTWRFRAFCGEICLSRGGAWDIAVAEKG